MKFFTYIQNNSGGGFHQDEESGIGLNVIIEANSSEEANDKAESIGLYFDGCDNDRDCSCCGDRWYRSYEDGTDTPRIYDQDVSSQDYKEEWMIWGPYSYIHYTNGTIKKVKHVKE